MRSKNFKLLILIGLFLGSINLFSAHSLVADVLAASKLGDLAKFKTIVIDVEALAKKNDLAAAKLRIKDLETSWDEVEPSLKPKAAADWHILDKAIDKAIDKALAALRADKPNIDDCKKTLAELHQLMDQFEK